MCIRIKCVCDDGGGEGKVTLLLMIMESLTLSQWAFKDAGI